MAMRLFNIVSAVHYAFLVQHRLHAHAPVPAGQQGVGPSKA